LQLSGRHWPAANWRRCRTLIKFSLDDNLSA
jgi:hypothetical protein